MRCCRSLGSLCLAACVLIFAPIPGQAQDYPSRPIRLIITSPAGSLVDVLGRLVAEELGARLGQTVVVDNRPGAMTQVGSDALNRAPADGYTLMIGTSEATMLPFLKKSVSLRSAQGLHADRAGRDVVDGVRGQSEGAGEHAAGAHRLFQGQSGQACATAAAASAARCTSRSRCSSSRAAATSCTSPIAAARRPRPTRSRARSRWCRWGSPRARRRGRQAAHPGADRPEPASDVRRCADHG